MKKVVFPLEMSMRGAEVRDLQDALVEVLGRGEVLGSEEGARRELLQALRPERAESFFGKATHRVVVFFQEERGLGGGGQVDEETAEALNGLLREWGLLEGEGVQRSSVVGGRITRGGAALAGVVVRAFHTALRGPIRLGQDVTDAEGHYTLRYEPLPGAGGVRLRVVVLGEDGAVLVSAEVGREAGAVEVVDLVVPVIDTPVPPRTVAGRIVLVDGRPAGQVTLRLYRRDFGDRAVQLDQTDTRDDGGYSFAFAPDAAAVSFEVRAVKGTGEEVALSYPLNDLDEQVELYLAAPTDLGATRAEYRRLADDLAPLVGELPRLAEAEESARRQDLTVLNRATGWDARLISLAATGERLSADPDVGLPAQGLYGLLRAGLPADRLLLAEVGPQAAGQALRTVRDAGIVDLDDQEIDEFTRRFAGFANRVRMAERAPGSNSTYRELLESSGLDEDAWDKFEPVYLDHRGDAAALWEAARAADLKEHQIGRLRLHGKLAFLTANSAALTDRLLRDVTAVRDARPTDSQGETGHIANDAGGVAANLGAGEEGGGVAGDVAGVRDSQSGLADALLERDLDRPEAWIAEINAAAGLPKGRIELTEEQQRGLEKLIPPAYEGGTAEERRGRWAEDMARKVRLSYPTQVVGRMVERDDADELGLGETRAATAALLKSAAAQGFRLGRTPLAPFLDAGAGNGARDAAAARQVKVLHRVYQITPGDEAMKVLLRLKLTSAYDITAMTEAAFLERYGGEFASWDQARLVYRKAVQVSSVAYNLFTVTRKLDSEVPLAAVSGTSRQHAQAKRGLADALRDHPTMASLFGSMDFCECEHCRSVLGPAAYLVDLLQFIDHEPAAWDGFLTHWAKDHGDYAARYDHPYEALTRRRPDLPHIPLTCENTQTILPYIDLVNEILEYHVAYGALTGDAARDTGSAAAEDLLAEPQHVVDQAYERLGETRYPLDLPYDLWLEIAREFCAYAGTPLPEVLEALRPGDALFAPGQDYDRAAVFIESLGLSPAEAEILSDPAPLEDRRWYELYGFWRDRPIISAPGGSGHATLTIEDAHAAKLAVGDHCTYFAADTATDSADKADTDGADDVGAPHAGTKVVSAVGEPGSGGPGRTVITFTGLWDTTPEEGDLLVFDAPAALRSARALARRLGVSYRDLADVVRTAFVNPALDGAAVLGRLGVGFHSVLLCRDPRNRELYDRHKDLLNAAPDSLDARDRARFDALSADDWRKLKEIASFDRRVRDLADASGLPPGRLEDELAALPLGEILMLADPDAGCDFDLTVLRYADGTPADDLAFLRINLFVRLWRALGWPMAETDRALRVLTPSAAPFERAHLGKRPLLTALIHLAHLKELDARLRLDGPSRPRLLTLWSDLSTTGENPLYARLFLDPAVLGGDDVFDDPLGRYLSAESVARKADARWHTARLPDVDPADRVDPAPFTGRDGIRLFYDEHRRTQHLSHRGVLSDADRATLAGLSASPALAVLLAAVQREAAEFPLIKGHLPALRGALGLTADDVARVLDDAGTSLDTAELSLANVSLLYRYALLAEGLGRPVAEVIALRRLSGCDPFTPLSPEPLTSLEEDHPFLQTLGFVDLAERVEDSGLSVADLDHLLRHRFDPTGPYRADHLGLVRRLAEGVRALHAEYAEPADPAALDPETLRRWLGLALAPDVVDRFLAMMNGTAEFTVAVILAEGARPLDPAGFTGEPAIRGLSYDGIRREQRLTFRGVLFDERKAALKARLPRPAAGRPHEPSALFGRLLDQVQEQASSYYAAHLCKQPPDAPPPAAGFLDPEDYGTLFRPLDGLNAAGQQKALRERYARLVGVFLPFLRRRLVRGFVVQTLTGESDARPELVEALLTDVRLLSPVRSSGVGRPLLDVLAGTAELGLTATFFASLDGTGEPLGTATLSEADTALKDAEGRPARPAEARSVRLEGHLEVPAAGPYRFSAVLDRPGARAQLRFAHLPAAILTGTAVSPGAEVEDGPYVELKPGIPYRFTLDLWDLDGGDARLLVRGEMLPKSGLDRLVLYPSAAVERAEHALVLLTKALRLLGALDLGEREIRHILTHPGDFGGIDLGALAVRDAQRALAVLAWDEVAADPGLTPGQALVAARGRAPDLAAEADRVTPLFGQVLRLMDYSRLKRAAAGGTDAFVEVFAAAGAGDQDRAYRLIAEVTRRDEATVRATAEALTAAPSFTDERPLLRLWEALRVVERFGVPEASPAVWGALADPSATAARRSAAAQSLKEAVKARLTPEAWRRAVQPISDALRRRRRDALVAHVRHRHGFTNVEQLYEYFLIDPGMEPVVRTSRIRLAISSVQLFVQRCLLNLEPRVHPVAILNAGQWAWMKRYRVWEANRKIFLFPENWLEPEFRDDKTPLFTELEGVLLQGDVSADLAEDAFLGYLRKLEELARLDLVAMHLEDGADPAHHTLHVIGRTYSEPHRYFYRRHTHGTWTPWEPVAAEIEGDHLAPVVWRDRLYLFWVTFLERPDPDPAAGTGVKKLVDTTLAESVSGLRSVGARKTVEAQLHWSEYLEGRWTARESGGFAAPLKVVVTGDFDPGSVPVHVSRRDAGVLVELGGQIDKAFFLAGRNSAPEAADFGTPPANPYLTSEARATRYRGSGPFKVKVVPRVVTDEDGTTAAPAEELVILRSGGAFTLLPCDNDITLGAPQAPGAASRPGSAEIAALTKPVFYADSTRTFFVEPTVTERTVEEWEEWVPRKPSSGQDWGRPQRWDEFVVVAQIPKKGPRPEELLERVAPESVLKAPPGRDWLVNPATGLVHRGELVGPEGRGLGRADGWTGAEV